MADSNSQGQLEGEESASGGIGVSLTAAPGPS
jgi:hypothetical protein